MSRSLKLVVHSDEADRFLDILWGLDNVELVVSRDYAGLPAILESFRPDVLFTIKFAGTPNFPREAIHKSASLRWLSVGGSGTDHLGVWDPTRLIVTNAAGVAARCMAEYVMGAALHFALGIPEFQRAQSGRQWSPHSLSTLAGRTMTIIGAGHAGRAVAKLAKTFEMRVIGVRARPAAVTGFDEILGASALSGALARSDYIAVCVPLTEATRQLLNRDVLGSVKPGAVLIDVSRGGVVDQSALAEVLRSGRLAGAALDVFETEPLPQDSPFWGMENVIVTPHSAGLYQGWERAAAIMFVENLHRWRVGQPLRNVVYPNRGY